MKRKITAIVVVAVMLLTICMSAHAEGGPEVKAPSAILVEKTTGSVLYEKDADKRMRPASVTKIMTMLLIMEAIDNGQYGYSDTVSVSANATSMGGSQVYLKEGEKFSVDEMIKCIAVASANDCCVAMAEYTAGSEELFVEMMNRRAGTLGMASTEFKNCTGLDADGHMTTARDISIMSRELLKHDDIKKYTGIWTDSIRDGSFGLSNTNKLIRFYDGATGLKTGYTSKSGYCISATAEKNGMELIAVIMAAESSDSRNADAKALLNYGFLAYELYTPEVPKISDIKVIKGKKKYVSVTAGGFAGTLIKKGESKDADCRCEVADDLEAPVEKGQKVGELTVYSGDKILYKTDIITTNGVRRAGIFDIFSEILHYFLIV